MAILPPGEHAARLLEYYIRSLAERSGLRWTQANTADFDQLADLLDQAEDADTIPPFKIDNIKLDPPALPTRVTVQLDQPGNDGIADPTFQRFRRRQYDEADDVRRLVRR